MARIAVLPIVLQDANVLGDLTPETVYTAAQKVLSHTLEIEPLHKEEISPVLRDAIDYCASDLACLSARFRSQQIDLALEVIVNARLDPALVTVQLIDSERGVAVANAVEESSKRASIGPIVERAVERVLVAAGHSFGGAAQIAVSPADAILSIEPQPSRKSATTFVAPAGIYRVTAEREGYEAATREIVLAKGTDSFLEIRLEEKNSLLSSAWFWAGVGAAAVAAGVVAIVLTSGSELRVCQARDPALCD